MNRDLVARILREELMVMKMNQKMLKEHKRLVSERKDWYSLVAEEYIRLEKGPDFDTSLIEEGVWDSIKNFVAKAGSLEKGGKIFGRTKRTAAAKDKLEAAIQKAVDTGMEDYITKFEAANPGFPNQKGQTVFVNSLFDIAAVYDTLDQGVQDGTIDPVSANAIVEALREFVLYNLDYELADIYKHFRENKEAEGEPLDEVAGVTPAAAPQRTGRMQRRASSLEAGQPVGPAPEDRDTFTKRGAQGDEVDSATIKGLKSNVLPLLLAGLGALGTGFGWLAQQPWFIDSLTPQTYETVWKPIIKGQKMGITQQLAALNGTPGANLSNMSLKDFVSSMQGHGLVDAAGNPTQNLLNMASDAGNNGFANWWSSNGLSDLAANGNQTLQNLIPASGAGAPGAGGDILTRKVVGHIAKKVATNAVGGAGAAAAGTAVAAGTLLTTLGLGTIAAGAAVKLVRMKGMKSSRAQLLKDLSIELQPFDVPEDLSAIDPPVDVIPGFTPPEPETATMPGEPDEAPAPDETPAPDGEPAPDEAPAEPEYTKPEQPYTFPLAKIEKMINDFTRENGVPMDETDVEDLVGAIESWMQSARERGADYFDMDDREFLQLAEAEVEAGTGRASYSGRKDRKRFKTGDPRIAIKKGGRSRRSQSLSSFLHQLFSIGNDQGRPEYLSSLNDKQLRKLKTAIVKMVYDDLQGQNAPIKQESQQDLNESKILSRWGVLAGINRR